HGHGFAAARLDLFKGAVVYVTPTRDGDGAAREIAHFWEDVLETHAVLIDAARHDRQLALTSHLPQAVASLLARYLAHATPPGAKSISHRALMLAALARGTSEITGLLTGEDVKSTARVLRQLGADISAIGAGTVTVRGSRLSSPASRLHCGNSGTTARLLLGMLAGKR